MVDNAWQEIIKKIPIGIERHQRLALYLHYFNLGLPHDKAIKKAFIRKRLPQVVFETKEVENG